MGVEDPKYVVVENDTVRQLQVTNVSAEDEGTYCCRVQNKQSLAQLLVARMCLQTVFSFLQRCFISLNLTEQPWLSGPEFIMRPSSLGGGRIMRRTLSVRLSVRPSRYHYYRASRRATWRITMNAFIAYDSIA